MPACPNGARPVAGAEDRTSWLDKLALDSAVALLIRTYMPATWASIGTSLISTPLICESNPDPPSPITLEDVLRQTANTVTGGALADPVVVEKAYQWLKYQEFLSFCECTPVESPPGFDCASPPASISLPSLGAIAGPFPITVSPEVLAARFIHPNGDWTWAFDGSAVVSGAATDGNNLLIQWQAANGTWVDGPELDLLNAHTGNCWVVTYQASVPKFGSSTAIRLINNAGGAYTVTNLAYCFCAPPAVPPPLPVQPPLTGVPTPPALACATDDLCGMVTELANRMTIIAAQISDIQASLVGTDVLSVLDEMNITGEGQRNLVQGTRAVSVELTALGDEAYTSALGNPRGLMRVGSIRWFDGTGYSFRRFIDADRFDDPRPVGALAVAWQLLPGTTGILKLLG